MAVAPAVHQFLCRGDWQSACMDRFYEDTVVDVFEHELVEGGTLWETHADKRGELLWNGDGYTPGDWVIACYPGRVRTEMRMVLPHHDGVVKAHYDWADIPDTYIVLVKARN